MLAVFFRLVCLGRLRIPAIAPLPPRVCLPRACGLHHRRKQLFTIAHDNVAIQSGAQSSRADCLSWPAGRL